MISSLLQGGLGNQMFQIAAASSLAKDLDTTAKFSATSHILNLQGNKAINYKINIFSNIDLSENNNFINNLEKYNETTFSFTEIPKKNNLILNGYFQTELYFKHNKEHIRNLFSETNFVKEYISDQYSDIDFNNSVSMHVRRGDYLRFPDIHPCLSIEYYNNAIKLIKNYKNLLVFSDDKKWCKANLKYDNIIYIDNEPDYIDLYLMSRCRDNIIANSSFSWWGAWLNKNLSKSVIAPNIWFGKGGPKDFQDIYPEGWIKCF